MKGSTEKSPRPEHLTAVVVAVMDAVDRVRGNLDLTLKEVRDGLEACQDEVDDRIQAYYEQERVVPDLWMLSELMRRPGIEEIRTTVGRIVGL